MKKILTMILSLALVLSMIPATASVAFAASGNGKVTIGETTYDVTVSETVFTYDGATKNPSVTLGSGAPSGYAVSYQLGGGTPAVLKDAGSYTILVTPASASQSYEVTGCTIEVKKASLTDNARIRQKASTNLTSNNGGIIAKPSDYFEVYDGAAALEASEVSMQCSYDKASDTYKVTATSANKNYNGFNVSGNFEVSADISSYSVTVVPDSIIYTGSTLTPTVTVKKDESSTPLVQGKDYTVEPLTKIEANKTCDLVVKGAGRYTGYIKQQNGITIKPRDIGTKDVTVGEAGLTVIPGNQPDITLIYGGKNLVKGKDYKYDPVETKDKGGQTVSVTVTGLENFTGTKQVKISVASSVTDLTAATLKASDLTYNGSAQEPTLILELGSTRVPLSYCTVEYKLNNSIAKYTETKPTNAGTYDVKVTAKRSNRGGFTGTQEFKKVFEIKPLSINDRTVTATYTGNILNPVTVKHGTTTLKKDTDYTTDTYSASRTFYTVTGKGNFTGSRTVYTTGTDISKYTVILRETTVTADGTAKTPVITKVAYGSSSLSSSDYTVSYQDSTGKTVTRLIEPGTYKVVVTGKNGYSGSCYATYTILGLTQSITGIKNYYKVYPTTQPFKLDPQAAEKTGFTFTSSDPTVASVDAYGYVTMHKPGRAKITITTKGTVKYNQTTTSTEIRVYPNKVTMSRNPWTTGKKGQIKVRWNKRVGATRYEIRYSRQKSFKKGSYKTKKATAAVNSYSTQSTTVSGLRKGYTYYVKVRAVTQVYDDYGQKVNYYGNWSKAKTVKVK